MVLFPSWKHVSAQVAAVVLEHKQGRDISSQESEVRRAVCFFSTHVLTVDLLRYITSPKRPLSISLFKVDITILVSAISLLIIPCRDAAVCAALVTHSKPISPTINNFYSQSHSHFKSCVLCNCCFPAGHTLGRESASEINIVVVHLYNTS